MPTLEYCYVSVFGSGLDVQGLHAAIGDPKSVAGSWRRHSPEPRSSVPAVRAGNVTEWKSAKEYYMPARDAAGSRSVWDYTAEEEHIDRFVRRWLLLRRVLPEFQTATTEIWLHVVYKAGSDERPSGIFLGKRLLDTVHDLGASISTEVIFGD